MNTNRARLPFFQANIASLPLWPIVLAGVLTRILLWCASEGARSIYRHNLDLFHRQLWIFVILAEAIQLVEGLAAIWLLKQVLPQANAYLRWPPARSYAGVAAVIGIAMASVMLVADYWPQILAHKPPVAVYEVTPIGIPGWLLVMLGAGVNEEILFRGALVGMLTALIPGRVRIRQIDLPASAYIGGVLFGAAHYQSFFARPLYEALAQQVYAFVWGLTYVWLMERSRSLVAPMIAHGVGDAVEAGAVMLWESFCR